MSKLIKVIVVFFIIGLTNLYALEIQKHYMDAKLSYISAEYSKALEEINKAYKYNEITKREFDEFLLLVKYVGKFSEIKYSEAKRLYKSGLYTKSLEILSEILARNFKYKKAINLYRNILKKLSESKKKEILRHIDESIRRNNKEKKSVLLIPLYTERLLLTPNDKNIKLKLDKVMFQYKSGKIKQEINLMLAKLERFVKKPFIKNLKKMYVLVNNILYIDPSNKKALMIQKKLDKIKLQKANKKSESKYIINERSMELRNTNKVMFDADISDIIIVTNNSFKSDKKLKQQDKHRRADIHFSRGINRYNMKLYKAAKDEFILARYYNPLLKNINKYIKLSEKKYKIIMREKNKAIKKDIKFSKKLLKNKKIEKAINLLYNSIITNNIDNSAGIKFLSGVIKKRMKLRKKIISPLDPLSHTLEILHLNKNYYYKKGKLQQAASFSETLLELYPENNDFLINLNNIVGKMAYRDKYKYLYELYDKALQYFYLGGYKKSLLLINFINSLLDFIKVKNVFRNRYLIKSKCISYIRQEDTFKNRISRIYNSAVFDYMRSDYINALNKWEYILKLEPWNIKARFNVNKVYNILNYKIKQMDNLLISKDKINAANKYYYNGIIAYTKDDYDTAIAFFKKVLDILPQYQKAKNNINKINMLRKMRENIK